MRCFGEVYADCDNEAIAHVITESWLSDRELCEEHLEGPRNGDCGYAEIDYYAPERTNLIIQP